MRLILCILICCISCKQTSKKNKILENDSGVPLEIAEYRSKQLQDVHYNLTFNIPEKKELPIASTLVLDATITDLSNPLYLDFKEASNTLKSIVVNKSKTPIVYEKEHVIITDEFLKIGANTIEIEFIAGELSLNRNADYLYTLLVPDRARTLFPCFDQPDIKANYSLNITAPKTWEVLCAASIKNKTIHDNTTTYQFEKSDKMSTYLFSFVAGTFEKLASENTRRAMTMLHRETNKEKLEASVKPIFDLHQSSLNFLEDYTQYKFPFKKLDFAVIPGFQYRGMEHVGAIQYRASSLFLDESATNNQKLTRAKLIAHETAHMWFGNLVTMNWFNDVWMKEVFANFMADKIVNPIFTDINHDLQFLTSHYPRAYGVDRTQGTNPIRQELDNLKNAGSLYGSIIYNKAPIMMRQLELALGKDLFQQGIKEYIKTYANSNTDWNGLVTILDKKTDLDLKNWSNIWVNSASRPIFKSEIAYDTNDKIESFKITQKAEDDSEKIWPQSFEVTLVYSDSTQNITINSLQKEIDIKEAAGLPKPKYILYNSNGYGYGVFPSDTTTISQIPYIKDEVTRAQEYINNYEHVLNGTASAIAAFNSLKKGLEVEENELILNLIKNKVYNLYWNYFTEGERSNYQSSLEAILYKRLQGKAPKNIKKILFNAYRSIAHSNQGIERLYSIWNKEVTIENLILNEDNYTAIAQVLALYNHPKANEILQEAKTKITNPDKLERFEFMLPALSHNSEERATFFKALKNPKNREKESWVESACAYIHHPLRQNESIKFVGLSLELLEEIQNTGDIFFPKGWLDNTIGKYTSNAAYLIVEKYIIEHPDLDENLMRKLKQSTDILYRKQGVNINKPD